MCFKKWAVATIACALEDKTANQTVLVLQGSQGIGKTTFLENLLPEPLKDYYYSGEINPSDKDTLINMSECLLINLDELSSLNKNRESALKEIITKTSIRVRRPYGRYSDNLPRRASFFGSVNDNQILSDTTGSRRFLINQVKSIDYQTPIDLDRFWAEAYELYKNGFQYFFDQNEIKKVNEANEDFEVINPEEESLIYYFKPWDKVNEYGYVKLTATQIAAEMNGGTLPNNSGGYVNKVGRALTKRGFEFVKINGVKKYIVTRTNRNVFELED